MTSPLAQLTTLALLGALALGCSGPRAKAPDLVLHHGKIFTADSAGSFVEALAITGERIVAVGSNDEILKLAGASTKRIDLAGKVVVPGFNDAHDHIGHYLDGVKFLTSADPTPNPRFAQIAESLKVIAARTPPGTWISTIAAEAVLSDPGARRAALDRIAPRHPVAIEAWTGHGVILNSMALAERHLGDTIRDPLGGRFERDGAGRLTGLLEEYAEFDSYYPTGGVSDSMLRLDYLSRANDAVALGITSIQNMTTSGDVATIGRIMNGLDLPVRLRMIRFPRTTPTGRATAEWRALASPAGSRIVVSGTKWILDGTPIERLAVQRAPYSDRPTWYGRSDFPTDTVRAMLKEILDAGDQPILHAVGDSTIQVILNTLAALAPDSVWRRLRPRIEHGEGTSPDQFALVRRLGITVVQNPTHLALTNLAGDRYGLNRMPILQPMKSLLKNGIRLALGSDGPQNPFLNIMLAVLHPDNPAEGITVPEAVTAYTVGSAYAEFQEKDKGQLAPGFLADLAVLSQDIFTSLPNTFPATTSLFTLVGGKPVYDPKGWLQASH